jgi:hypothetical protein
MTATTVTVVTSLRTPNVGNTTRIDVTAAIPMIRAPIESALDRDERRRPIANTVLALQ